MKTCFWTKFIVPQIAAISTSCLTMKQKNISEGELTEKEIYTALTSIASNKSPDNDGLTKEFYNTFWHEVKNIFMKSLRESKGNKLKVFHKEKPNKDRRLIQD